MKNLQRAVLLLSLLSLLGSAGVGPICASCGPKVMDCCKGDSSRSESLNESPCCDFRMSVTVEPHPARMTPIDSRSFQEKAPLAPPHVATRPTLAAVSLHRPATAEGAHPDTSPPLFLLNASFLC